MEMTNKQQQLLQSCIASFPEVTPDVIEHLFTLGIDSVLVDEVQRPVCSKASHPTERKYPEQTEIFKTITNEMYELHLQKNQDYSPSNINGVGMLGLATRIWDKTIRLMNLLGFNIEAKLISFDGAREPKNESIDDTFKDLANYGVIGMIMRAQKWGK
jgi:hypothetical protein